ncbi:ATP-binding protein [Candidatus Magnetomonas plexicatena]|uniref:ATP-binding protein n=1 Tax=Candidatus Magnetomonas plexicatena TaxID=2552947 RepID=UPI001C741F60|nr:GAF domain-containing protein [Nitrospirales bacterium LBB_01]
MKKLQNKILAGFLPLVIIPTIIVAVIFLYVLIDDYHDDSKELLSQSIRGVVTELNLLELNLLHSAQTTAMRKDISQMLESNNISALLPLLQEIQTMLGASLIRIVSPEGFVIANENMAIPENGKKFRFYPEILEKVLKGEDVTAILGTRKGIVCKAFVPIKTDGKPVGMLQVGKILDNEFLNQVKDKYRVDGIVYNGDLPQASTFTDSTVLNDDDLKVLLADVKKSNTQIIREMTLGTSRYYVVAKPLGYEKKLSGVLMLALLTDEYIERMRGLVVGSLILLALLVLISIFISRRISLNISKPIGELSKVTQSIAEGSTLVTVNIKSQDEVGVLAYSFNKMIGELKKYQDHLTELVEEKTMELTKTNAELVKEISERIKAEEQKEQTLNLLQNIANSVPGAIYQFRLSQDGSSCFPYASAAFRDIYRIAPEEVKEDASRVFTLLHPDDYDSLFASVRKSAEDLTQWQHESRLVFDDGTVRWAHGNAMPQREADGSILWQGFITDITERKRMEQALSEQLQILKLISEVDIVLSLNKSMNDMLQRCCEIIVIYLKMAFIRIWLLNTDTNNLELQASAGIYTHTDGGHAKIPVGMYKIGKIAEEAKPHLTNSVQTDTRVSNKEWAIKEGMAAFAGYPLIFEGLVLGVIAGFSKNELTESSLNALGSLSYNISIAIKNKQAESELIIAKKQAEDKTREVVKINEELETEISIRKGIEAELHDMNVHLEKRVEDEIAKMRQQEQMLIQQSKLASMGEMIGLIAHQWRQPLNALALNVQDMNEAYIYGEMDEKYVEKSVNSSMQQIGFMSKTIDDFRNFFMPTKKKVQFDVNSAIEELLSMFLQIFNKSDIDFSVKVEHDTVLLTEGYPSEFKQVVLNILNNSKDAIISKIGSDTNKHGKIEINLCNNESKSKIIVSIKDNGGGIPDDVIEKIFDSYFTTKGAEGTGVGLYMSKTIIETNMGGSLTVKNVDGGAEFVISLNTSGGNDRA